MAGHKTNNSEARNRYMAASEPTQTSYDGCPQCQRLMKLVSDVELYLSKIEQRLAVVASGDLQPNSVRTYYSVSEFAELVHKSEYTVREWCRLYRINAEKCDSGHGDSKAWKIPADELIRYQNNGLLSLPSKY